MIYNEAVNYIHSLLRFGIRPGLSGMGALLRLLGNPEKRLKYVHVAGTNGKGSTSTAISNVLIDAGYKVGLYTSPYVSHFLERVQFSGEPVEEQLFADCVEKVKVAVEKLEADNVTITEFEALSAAAFLCYEALCCDVVVLEVGLGGRLDATNIIDTPLVNVLTSLSIDHSAILGNTIEEIAFEKCGTIKRGGNVVCSFGQPQGALDMVFKTVKDKNNTLILPDKNDVEIIKTDIFGTTFAYKNYKYFVPMAGAHQVKNMTCVIEACNVLKTTFEISYENIFSGISKTVLPARIEVLHNKPLVILDGGHNEDGAKAFFEAVSSILDKKSKIVVIAGMMGDKAVESSLKPLMEKTDVFYAVTPENPRAMTATELSEIAKKYVKEVYAVDAIVDALELAYNILDENCALFVVGSLYLAGEIREALKEKIKKSD